MKRISNRNIVIVTSHYSVVAKGIEKNLKDVGYDPVTIPEDCEEMEEYAKEAALFIVYLPEENIESSEGIYNLEEIHSILQDAGKKMIVIGEKNAHDVFFEAVPELKEHFWMNRPIDGDELMRTIRKILEGGDKEARGKKEQKQEQKEEKKEVRILIVDDDPSYAKMIREWLKERYKINVLTTGKLVMSFLEKSEVDLILLDYEMPEMNGAEVLEVIRQNPKTAKIPVVFLTGVNTKEQIVKVMSLGPAGYILKSTARGELIDKLERLI